LKEEGLNLDTKKTVQYWLEGSLYDLETAESLWESGRYPYALFFGHLAIEKLLKAVVVRQTGAHAPFTHSLILLASKLTFEIPTEIRDNLGLFMEFYSEARYPEEQREFYKKCTPQFTRQSLDKVKEVYHWFRQKLDQ
jgi:HEPN domain-containing protein